MKRIFFCFIVLGLAVICGCEGARWFAWTTTPRNKTTVEPEYSLKNKTVAVLIYCEEGVLFEYPNVRLTLGTKIASELENYIKGVKVISPLAAAKYQDDHIYWDIEDPRKVAKELKSDAVLIGTLVSYTTHEPGLMNTYQGHIVAEAKLFEANAKDQEPIWETEESLEEKYPDEPRMTARLEPMIRAKTESLLAAGLVRKFYKHKFYTDEHENKIYEAD